MSLLVINGKTLIDESTVFNADTYQGIQDAIRDATQIQSCHVPDVYPDWFKRAAEAQYNAPQGH